MLPLDQKLARFGIMSFQVWDRLQPPSIAWHQGTRPIDTHYDEGFHSEQPLAEAMHVFLEAQSLPKRFSALRGPFTIGELGFGAGLNFRAVAELFQKCAKNGSTLTYLSVEKKPWDKDSLRHFHNQVSLPPSSLTPWLDQYPPRVPGRHQIRWQHQSKTIVLTLMFLEVEEALDELIEENVFRANAWFLDGFSPQRNPAMWAPTVCKKLAQLSQTEATLSTYSAAGVVRKNLTDAGFHIERRHGFGRKRHMVVGKYHGSARPARNKPAAGRVAIVGAGVAGVSLARPLMEAGLEIDLIAPSGKTHTASCNESGLLFPRLARIWEPRSLWLMHAHAFAHRFYRDQWGVGVQDTPISWHPSRRPLTENHMENLMDDPEWVQPIPGKQDALTLRFPRGMIIQPKLWLTHTLALLAASPRIRIVPRHLDAPSLKQLSKEYAALFVCAGAGSLSLLPSLQPHTQLVHGQIDAFECPTDTRHLKPMAGDFGYLIPSQSEHAERVRWISGATFEPDKPSWATSEKASRENLHRLKRMLSPAAPVRWCMARAAVRLCTRQRIPLIGRMPAFLPQAENNIFLSTGFGGHGFTLAPLAGQALASEWLGSLSPMSWRLYNFAKPTLS